MYPVSLAPIPIVPTIAFFTIYGDRIDANQLRSICRAALTVANVNAAYS